jgi:hypothetical protein
VVALSTHKSATVVENKSVQNHNDANSLSSNQGSGAFNVDAAEQGSGDFLAIDNPPEFYSYLVKPWNIEQIIGLLESLFGDKTDP